LTTCKRCGGPVASKNTPGWQVFGVCKDCFRRAMMGPDTRPALPPPPEESAPLYGGSTRAIAWCALLVHRIAATSIALRPCPTCRGKGWVTSGMTAGAPVPCASCRGECFDHIGAPVRAILIFGGKHDEPAPPLVPPIMYGKL
jgi:hypothetical protein